eukprot:gene2205-33765_t
MVRNGADPLSEENAAELSSFFDRLVDLIPAKYYHDEEHDRMDLRYMKKAARAEAKASFKVQHKKAKLAKLDPDTPSTVLELQQQLLQGKLAKAEGEMEKGSDSPAPAASEPEEAKLTATLNIRGSESREELKERLAKKIEAAHLLRVAKEKAEAAKPAKEQHAARLLRVAKEKAEAAMTAKELKQKTLIYTLLFILHAARLLRVAKEKAEAAKTAKEWKQKTLTENVNKKQSQQQQQKNQDQKGVKRKSEASKADSKAKKTSTGDAPAEAGEKPGSKGGAGKEDGTKFAFQRIEVDDGFVSVINKGGKKKASKEDMLKAAEARQVALKEMEASADGKVRLKEEAWKSALKRATGEKVLDDPKLLKRSLKKEAKSKEKSAKGWKERTYKEKEAKDKQQTRRNTNLKARVDGKLAKKKEKREKKLLRAGFEGRKEGFIGGSKGK